MGCSENGKIEIDLTKDHQEIFLAPKSKMVTSAFIEFESMCDCNVKIDASGAAFLLKYDIEKIIYEKWHEWYYEGRTIFISTEGCSEKSHLELRYKFIHDLF